MAKKLIAGVAVLAATALLAGCSSGASSSSDTGKVTGEITVLTNRTDIVDTTFKDYAAQFEKAYPGTKVKFEAIAKYETDVATRMSSGSYGDVLLIPNTVTKAQLPQFFEPLDSVEKLGETYRFVNEAAYDGEAYGVAQTGNAQGIVYNKKVWTAAGITDLPTTPTEFLADLTLIKDKTDAVPYYTNYKDGWPLSQWDGNRAITGDADESNKLIVSDAPWAKGQYHEVTDGLLFDIVKDGLSEEDPSTTDWETSKTSLGSGKVASMVLGSWSITQMQDAAVTAGGAKEDIGYMPFPYQVDGKFYSTVAGDYKNGISTKSENKATARAWIDWFAQKSGYAAEQGGLSPLVDGEVPAVLDDFTTAGVEYLELTPAPAGKETLENDIVSSSEIDLTGNIYRAKLIDIARGAAEGDKASYFAELNKKWADAVKSVG
ncbi:ABC transporter substrate-binding protein [Cryobacterium cryoconiti]|uniref:Extracellular solute-binding protein n=1 Tax=Cryobacterium cryoconiti TaxID=1259239 RepID=A0A4Y8JSF9_9MICO|nr:extracellular solute-binding protein [Cryobacterium cryoconiti]TFD28959.1 extracellular solute-binding protein [Cryobacterium cryoconiti]